MEVAELKQRKSKKAMLAAFLKDLEIAEKQNNNHNTKRPFSRAALKRLSKPKSQSQKKLSLKKVRDVA